jgi:hypothetical protein
MSVLQSAAGSSAFILRLQYQQLSLLQLIVRSCINVFFLFSQVEYCNMHFVCGFCDGNARAAFDEYQSLFSTEGFRLRVYFLVFARQHVRLFVFQSVALQSEREVVPLINARKNILEMVQISPLLSTRRTASRRGVSRMQVWRTLH